MTKRKFNKEYYDAQPKYQAVNNTVGRGGQIGAITYKDKTVVELYDWFCLMHPIQDIERSTPNRKEYKLNPIKMNQGTDEEVTKEGIRVRYFKTCPKCYQLIYDGEYLKDA